MRTIGQPLRTTAKRAIATTVEARDSYYDSAEHRAWSREVLRRAAGMCAACGALGRRLVADHRVEIRDGGSRTDPGNGQALCAPCHGRKTAATRTKRHSSVNIGGKRRETGV
jgi:5-methylcytosine-specific restriction endonuclease McrA